MTKQTMTDVSGGTTYYWEADLGRATTDKFWVIKKTVVSGAITTVSYPIGNDGNPSDRQEFAWADRTTLNFSLTPDTTAPTLSTVTIASDNTDTTKATIGDVITLTIVSSEYIKPPVVTIAGFPATVTEGADDLHFTATYEVDWSETEWTATFSIAFEDIGGRSGTTVTALTGGSGVTIDYTAPTASLLYSTDAGSTYSASVIVKNADTLRIKATFSEALLDSPVVKLAINNAVLSATNMTKTSTTVYYYDLNVPAGDIATATCSLSVGTDGAGNLITAVPTANATFGIDNTLPTLASATRTNNTTLNVVISELGDTASITKSNDGGFVVTETGGVPTYAVSAIAPGADNTHIILTVASMSASSAQGVTVTYVSAVNGTVADRALNLLATDAVGVIVAPW